MNVAKSASAQTFMDRLRAFSVPLCGRVRHGEERRQGRRRGSLKGYATRLRYFVNMVASTFMPGRSTRPLAWSIRILTGMRCTTLTKLPVAFSGGSRLKRLPVAPEMESTWPETERPYMSTLISARCPGCTVANCVSLKLAVTHTSCNRMTVSYTHLRAHET